jgi:hypothetical protein
VPCPTTLVTAGFLLAAVPAVPRRLAVIPVLWSIIGGSAALLLGVVPDLMLFVAGAALAMPFCRGPSIDGGPRKARGMSGARFRGGPPTEA